MDTSASAGTTAEMAADAQTVTSRLDEAEVSVPGTGGWLGWDMHSWLLHCQRICCRHQDVAVQALVRQQLPCAHVAVHQCAQVIHFGHYTDGTQLLFIEVAQSLSSAGHNSVQRPGCARHLRMY